MKIETFLNTIFPGEKAEIKFPSFWEDLLVTGASNKYFTRGI